VYIYIYSEEGVLNKG